MTDAKKIAVKGWLAKSLEGSTERFNALPIAIRSRSTAFHHHLERQANEQ
jgi:hypothetical protein